MRLRSITHLHLWTFLSCASTILGLALRSSVFLGRSLVDTSGSRIGASSGTIDSLTTTTTTTTTYTPTSWLVMRKQKASDKRTRRRQRGILEVEDMGPPTVTASPMQVAGPWRGRALSPRTAEGTSSPVAKSGGRGRSRKRSTLYNSLSFYHNHFLRLLTMEYQVEEQEVLTRLKYSLDHPLALEQSGYALFDLYPSRRGNLFTDEVYRLCKASDATTTYPRHGYPYSPATDHDETGLPSNHKFSKNDVIMLTLQPNGSGDFYNPASMPTNELAVSLEARVLSGGPTYIDIAVPAGQFEAAFGPAPNDRFQQGDASMRLRMDRFFSKVPYERMVDALKQMTTIPSRRTSEALPESASGGQETNKPKYLDAIVMDEVIRETILSTFAYNEPHSPMYGDPDACNVQELANRVSKPPMRNSHKLTSAIMAFIDSKPDIFQAFNAPQRAAIEAALTRRLTMIQGPPGSGKTTVAAAIAFGFAKQCRAISPHTKVLACAFSNVGADNLAEAMLRLGLKVVRIGKASAISESLWNVTLDAAIDQDEDARKALKLAAQATAKAAKLSKTGNYGINERAARDEATAAVKEATRACNIAATKAFREADVIISTSTGAADPRLLAACGIASKESVESFPVNFAAVEEQIKMTRELAPDLQPPLSLPFVLVDEACQSVEPATLIPLVSSNSCRSLVLLGDPCQLPPTVRSGESNALSLSLMERLSMTLPRPTVGSRLDNSMSDRAYLESLAIKQCMSLMRSMGSQPIDQSYRRRFSGSLLLSVQYRMHPSISAFPSAIFYDGLLATPNHLSLIRPFPSSLNRLMPSDGPQQSVRVINIGGRNNERQGKRKTGIDEASLLSTDEQTSFWNEPEAIRVLSILKEVIREDCGVASIGIISPYNGQVQLIKTMISSDSELQQLFQSKDISIEINSVDGYQGRERDMIIFSSVRSNRSGRIGFLQDWRRMNVAMTRAKSALVVVGDLETLSVDRHWAAFSKYAQGLDIVYD